jgi:hypothetical protein
MLNSKYRGRGGFLGVENLDSVPQGQLFFAVQKMDLFNHIRDGFEKLASDPSFGFTEEDINEILEQSFNGQYEEFPIPEFRSNDYDEVLQQLPEMVRSLKVRDYSLTTLLAREQAIIAIKAVIVQIKKIDKDKIFKNRKTHGGVDSNTITDAIAHYIADIFFSFTRKEWRQACGISRRHSIFIASSRDFASSTHSTILPALVFG